MGALDLILAMIDELVVVVQGRIDQTWLENEHRIHHYLDPLMDGYLRGQLG